MDRGGLPEYLRTHALKTEGIFRVPGNNAIMKKIVLLYEQEADVVLESG